MQRLSGATDIGQLLLQLSAVAQLSRKIVVVAGQLLDFSALDGRRLNRRITDKTRMVDSPQRQHDSKAANGDHQGVK